MASPDWLKQWKRGLPDALPLPDEDDGAATGATVDGLGPGDGKQLDVPAFDRPVVTAKADPPEVSGEWQPSGKLMPPLARAVKGFTAAKRKAKPAPRSAPKREAPATAEAPGIPLGLLLVAGGVLLLVAAGVVVRQRLRARRPKGPAPEVSSAPGWSHPMGPTIEELRGWNE